MKKEKANKANKLRKQYLNKMETRESTILETLSALQSNYGKNTEFFNSKVEYVKSKIYQKTEVNIIK
jgi:hypothetical protein